MKRHQRAARVMGPQPLEADSVDAVPRDAASGVREWMLLGVVMAVGVGLRINAVARSAVEHFDEGVYASNLYFGPPEYAYPLQRFYAPPLLPALIEAGGIVGLPANLAALLPSFLAGCGTIFALWWFGRSWLGPRAAIAAATLVALSPFHIAFSAAALTDVLLGLWLVLAVDALGRSLVVGTLRVPFAGDGTRSVPATSPWAIIAGIYTGLAWWTKYNGWLPLAIGTAALPVLWGALRPPWRELRGWLASLAVMAVVAGLMWSPYYFSLRGSGGYGPIAENHAKYVVGLAGWLDGAARQAANFFILDGGWSGLALLVATGLTLLLPREPADRAGGERPPHAIGSILVGVGWLGLLAATPCYWPYPRLLLPWLLATGLGAGWVVDRLTALSDRGRIAGLAGVAILAAALAGLGRHWTGLAESIGDDRRAVQILAGQLRHELDALAPPPRSASSPPTRLVYVFGEPALYFQLAAANEPLVAPVQEVATNSATLAGQSLPTFLVAGPHAMRDPRFREQLTAAGEKWKLVQRYTYRPSRLVWLDLHDPRRAAAQQESLQHELQLYRFQP